MDAKELGVVGDEGFSGVVASDASATILILDDEYANVALLTGILSRAGYSHTIGMSDPHQALEHILAAPPDLLLLDLHMPELDGFGLMSAMEDVRRHDGSRIPIIVLTADATTDTRRRALAYHADDFLSKPFDIVEVLLRIKNALGRQVLERQVRLYNDILEARVQARTAELEAAYAETFERLALATEYRDDDTGQHTRRVGSLARRLAERLGFTLEQATLLEQAASLHDIGKVGIPDDLLLRPGPLTPVEFDVVKTHTTIGAQLLSGSRSPLLQLAEKIALSHHERWDGEGYHGLKGEDILQAARITTVADAFDAITNDRPYRPARTIGEAIEIMIDQRGRQFDPEVVDALLALDLARNETY